MIQLKDIEDIDLEEDRTVILGVEILLGFGFAATFSTKFNSLSILIRYSLLAALGFLIISVALLVAPTSFQLITPRSWDRRDLNNFVTSTVSWGLLFFALSLATAFVLAASAVEGMTAGYVVGGVVFLLAILLWYGYALYTRRINLRKIRKQRLAMENVKGNNQGQISIAAQIKILLVESRVVLPGIQALLGFQFAAILTTGFQNMQHRLQVIHLASMIAVLFSILLLIAPIAYHRIALEGIDSQRLVQYGDRMIILSIVFLALGISSDFFVVIDKSTGSNILAFIALGVTLLLYFGLWFGYSIFLDLRFRRTHRQK